MTAEFPLVFNFPFLELTRNVLLVLVSPPTLVPSLPGLKYPANSYVWLYSSIVCPHQCTWAEAAMGKGDLT